MGSSAWLQSPRREPMKPSGVVHSFDRASSKAVSLKASDLKPRDAEKCSPQVLRLLLLLLLKHI